MLRNLCAVTLALFTLGVLSPLAAPRGQPAPPPGGLVQLIEAQGVSGFESDVRSAVQTQLPSWARARVDEIGNLIVTIGEGSPHTLLVTNMDEDGYVVSDVAEDGYLRLQRITAGAGHRLFDQFHYGQPVLIRTTQGAFVHAVTGAASSHLQRGREQSLSVKGLDDLVVDVGATTRAEVEQLGVQMLDTVTLRERSQILAGGRVAGVAAQARANAFVLVEALRAFDRAPAVKGTLTVAWATQGRSGERGLARLAQELDPDQVVIAVPTGVTKETDARGAIGRLGGGLLLPQTDLKGIELAQQRAIPFQAVPALAAATAWPAAKVQVVALPALFAQSPVETVDLRDAAAMVDFLRATVGLPEAGAPRAARSTPSPKAAVPGPARSGESFGSEALRMLGPLIETYGVAGRETPVRELIQSQLPKWATPEVDARGNLTVSFGHGGKELLFVAHMDEIGYEVTSILEDGTATVRKRGGFFDILMEAHPALVHTAKGPVPAVVAPRPHYAQATEGPPKTEEIFVYLGTTSRQETEALGVAQADTVTVRKKFAPLSGTRATARSIDDRAGVACLLAALNRLEPAAVPNRVTFAWVIGEETGLVGSQFLAERAHPQYVFAVDTFVSSDSPLDPQRIARIALGSGAVIRAIDTSSITPPEAVARVVAVARARRLPVSVGTTNGGNDGSVFSRFGSIVVPISWPGRFSHSPVEVIDSRDLDALVGLVAALAQEF